MFSDLLDNLSNTRDRAAQLAAVASLSSRLANNAINRTEIGQNGAISALSDLIFDTNSSVELRKQALVALGRLVDRHPINQEKFYDLYKASYNSLFSLLDDNSDMSIRGAAAEMIGKMICDNIKIREHFNYSSYIIKLTSLFYAPDIQTKRSAVICMKELLSEPNYRDNLSDLGIIKGLVYLLNQYDIELLESTTKILWVLTVTFVLYQKEIVSFNGIPLLVSLLGSDNTAVNRNAAGALWNLASNPVNKVIIASANGVKRLAQLLAYDDEIVQKNVVAALWNLVNESTENRITLFNINGAMQALHKLIETDMRADIKRWAREIIGYCRTKSSKIVINRAIDISEIEDLSFLLRPHNNIDVRREAAAALRDVACANEDNKNMIIASEGIQHLMPLLANSNAQVIKNAIKVLKELAQSVYIRDFANEITWHVVEFLNVEYGEIGENAIEMLWHFLQNHSRHLDYSVYIQQISLFINFLESKSVEVKRNVALILQQLKDREYQLDNLNGLKLLVQSLNDDDAIVKENIAEFLRYHVQTYPDNSLWSVDASLLPILKKLAGAETDSNIQQSKQPVTPTMIATEVISFDDIILGKKLGRGGFGAVCEGLWNGATQVAVKQLLDDLTPDLLEEFQRETNVHARLRHPNIIALYGVCMESMKYAMVLEFMANGSLYDVLKSPAELPWSLRMSIALDLSSGLLYLHGQHIIHRDLKSLNILIDDRMRAKIADFGLAKLKLTSASMTKGGGGTTQWEAPELFDDASNSAATDVYATGIVFWEVAARKLPYEGKTKTQIIRYVDSGKRETIPAETPEQFTALITRCWAQRAEDRPDMREITRKMQDIKSGSISESSSNAATLTPSIVSSGYQAFSYR